MRRPAVTCAWAAVLNLALAAACASRDADKGELAAALAAMMSTPGALEPKDSSSAASSPAPADANLADSAGVSPASTDANLTVPTAGEGNAVSPLPRPTDPWLRSFTVALTAVKTDQCSGSCASAFGSSGRLYSITKTNGQYFTATDTNPVPLTVEGSVLKLSEPRHAVEGGPSDCQGFRETSTTLALDGDVLTVYELSTFSVSCPSGSLTCLCDLKFTGRAAS